MQESVTVFKVYPFEIGQKIHIKGSRRRGDWEVVDLTDAKVTLRCPISQKEVTWNRFCYFAEQINQLWPDVSSDHGEDG